MKKIIALALALVFAFALAVPAFADATNDATLSENVAYNVDLAGTSNNGDAAVDDDGVDKTIIQYDVKGNYIVTIPALIELKSETTPGDVSTHNPDTVKATQTATVTVADVMIPYETEFVVAMQGSGASGAFCITTAGQTIDYTVKRADTTAVAPSATIVATTADDKAQKDVLVVQAGGERAADDFGYTEGSVTLTFEAVQFAKYQARYSGTITFTVGTRECPVTP